MNVADPYAHTQQAAPRILRRSLAEYPGYSYLIRLPENPDPDRLLLVVHGIARQAGYMLQALSNEADKASYTMIAPLFSYRDYPDYQRLGRSGKGKRADLAVLATLADLRENLEFESGFHLFGFSGGAQFAHRFVYAWPDRVRSVCLASAGWYTPPDGTQRFPYGTGNTERLRGVDFHADRLARTPTLVAVGNKDTDRDEALRQTDRVDTLQGRNRRRRAEWFHRSLKAAAAQRGHRALHEFALLDDTRHDFGEAVHQGGLASKLFDFCERAARHDN
ncbi:MAG: alpha/beta hydrolase [Pseudomonadota bacterium]